MKYVRVPEDHTDGLPASQGRSSAVVNRPSPGYTPPGVTPGRGDRMKRNLSEIVLLAMVVVVLAGSVVAIAATPRRPAATVETAPKGVEPGTKDYTVTLNPSEQKCVRVLMKVENEARKGRKLAALDEKAFFDQMTKALWSGIWTQHRTKLLQSKSNAEVDKFLGLEE